ncbi:MAG: alpha/beta fold hydrolase [Bacteroidota bacterium]
MRKLIITTIALVLLAFCTHAQKLKRRASLGFTPVPIDSTMISDLGMNGPKGLLITRILDQGSMSMLKAENRDVLLEINGVPTNTFQELLAVRSTLREGDDMKLKVIRNGEEKTLTGKASLVPYETSQYSEVIYDQFDFKEGRIRTIVNKPNKPGKHPAIFFIPGYICASIDNLNSLNPYRKLLDSLVAKGYAVFRMEKPGMGDNENTGDCRQLGFHQEVDSYLKGYEQLKKYDFIDQHNIFLWGHSMGGLYAPIVASKKQPKGVVFYGMVHDSWPEYLLRMVRYQNPRISASDYLETDKDIRTLYSLLYKHYHLGKSSKELAKNPEFDKILKRDFWFDGENQILLRHENFWRELYEYSMTEAFHDFQGFVLSMNGEADIEVINDFSQREVIHIVNTFHPGKGEFYYLPKTDHMMIEVGTLEEGAVLRYQPRYREMMANNFNYDIVDKTDSWIQDKLDKTIEETKVTVIEDWYNHIDLTKIKPSSDSYNIVWRGDVAGSMNYHKKIENGKLIVQDTSELEGMVWEKLDMVLNMEDLTMETGEIVMKYPQNKVDMEGSVSWKDHAIKGEYKVDQNGVNQKTPIDFKEEKRVLGRGAIFGLVSALPIAVNQKYLLDMFAFSSAEIWNMVLEVEGKKTIEWKNQTVEAYKMNLTGGKVDNVLYMATDGTDRIFRIDVIGQDMQVVLK